jgi:hypothetical protein
MKTAVKPIADFIALWSGAGKKRQMDNALINNISSKGLVMLKLGGGGYPCLLSRK